MGKIGYGYGSEWHLLRYLGYHRQVLDSALETAIGGKMVGWLDAAINPSAQFGYSEWKGVDFLPGDILAKQQWLSYWPQSGNVQNWDAVGLMQRGPSVDWLLVEAKGHKGELKSRCAAKSREGIAKIQHALDQTREAMGISVSWSDTEYYQFCNRLAALNFLMSHNVSARLVHVYFLGNVMPSKPCFGTEADWRPVIDEMHQATGFGPNCKYYDRIHEVFLSAHSNRKG